MAKNPPLPKLTCFPNWPSLITDAQDFTYYRVRDGNVVSPKTFAELAKEPLIGNDCIYLLVNIYGEILDSPTSASQYTPALGYTSENLTMNSYPWTTNETYISNGVPPMTLPPLDHVVDLGDNFKANA